MWPLRPPESEQRERRKTRCHVRDPCICWVGRQGTRDIEKAWKGGDLEDKETQRKEGSRALSVDCGRGGELDKRSSGEWEPGCSSLEWGGGGGSVCVCL